MERLDWGLFWVEYPTPPEPQVQALWDVINGVAQVSVHNPTPTSGQATPTHNELWRSIDGGVWTLIADTLPPQGAVTDPTAPAAGEIRYRAVALTALLASSESEPVPLDVPAIDHRGHAECATYVSGGPGYGITCRALYNPELSFSRGRRDRTLYWFAGRSLPVEHAGPGLERTLTLTWRVLPEWESDGGRSASREEWERLVELPGPHLVRDCQGRRFYASLGDLTGRRLADGTYSMTLTATEVSA